MIFAVAQVNAQQYLVDGANPVALTLETDTCQTISISLDPAGVIDTPLITGGFWLYFNPAQVVVNSVAAADGEVPGPWDPGFTSKVPDPDGPGTYFFAVGQFGTVAVGAPIPLADVELCCQAAGVSQIEVITIPNFDTNVGDTTVWDPQITPGIIDLTQVGKACGCEITGTAEVLASAFDEVTAQYNVGQLNPEECGTSTYVWSDDCTLGDVDQTGLLTVPATTTGEVCTITVVDTANTDLNTGGQVTCSLPIEIVKGDVCKIEIARGRECPGEEIDDPAYNRPGRRGLVASCGDIIDFTVCENCAEPSCLEWDVNPDLPWLNDDAIVQIDDCCWRLTIGDMCEEIDKSVEFEITVTDPCNNDTSDSIVLEVGKVVIDLGDTAVDPQSGTAEVDVNLINPNHHVRALSFDVEANNLVCTACTADPVRALQFTCSAADPEEDGICSVVMYSTNPAALIAQGSGQIATILYDAVDPAAGNCEVAMPVNEVASDQFNEDLCACGAPGEVCFKTCGDIYPQDCVDGPCGDIQACGDGVVDLFDILEAIDIILGLQTATECQIGNADVPNGMPPYCGNPPGDPNCQSDGDVDIFDVLVMIDKALGKANCCDYCTFGNIF